MNISIIPRPDRIRKLSDLTVPANSPVLRKRDYKLSAGEYLLRILSGVIFLSASDNEGFRNGMNAIKQLRFCNNELCECELHLKPRFPYRSFMIDSARHMQTVDEIKKMIEAAALFGFNVFHWHLCDDQGFRIESDIDRLNEISSYRENDRFGNVRSDNRYGGYYTREEIRDIVEFCRERCITVVPEIDMPGHTTAIISAYPNVSCEGKNIPVRCTNGIFPEILCAGKEETFDLIFRILDEVTELFPGEYIHIGGDEAPKTKWENCTACKERMKSEGLADFEQLQGYFMNRVAGYLRQKGKTVIAWNESLKSGTLDDGIVIQKWLAGKKECLKHAQKGGRLICSDMEYVYLDYPYGMTPLDKVYSYPIIPKGVNEDSVMGIDTPLWTEYITDFGKLCYQGFPRMLAVAEIASLDKYKCSYNDFQKRLSLILPILEEYGITPAPEKEWERDINGVKKMIDFLWNCRKH